MGNQGVSFRSISISNTEIFLLESFSNSTKLHQPSKEVYDSTPHVQPQTNASKNQHMRARNPYRQLVCRRMIRDRRRIGSGCLMRRGDDSCPLVGGGGKDDQGRK